MRRRLATLGPGLFGALLMCILPQGALAARYTLADFYRMALQNAERIKISEENLAIAETGKEKAMALLYPRLSGFSTYTRWEDEKYGAGSRIGPYTLPGSLIQPRETGTWGVRMEESLSLSGREWTALAISRENILKSAHELDAAREEYLLNVAQAYYSVLKAGKNLEIADANVERLATYRDAAEKRLKVGEVTKTVLLRAEAELSGARSDRMAVRNGLELARAQLKRIAAVQEDFEVAEAGETDMEIPSLDVFQATALSERADLKGLEMQRKIAEDQVRFARGAYWPNLSLTGGYIRTEQSPETSSLNREGINAGAALNFPFFEGGLRVAEVKEAKARERQSQLLYEDLKKAIAVEVQSAYLEMFTQKSILQFLVDQRAFARDNYNAVNRQFEFGLAQSIDVIDANTLLVSAEQKVAEAGYGYRMSILRVKKAAGVLLKEILAAG